MSCTTMAVDYFRKVLKDKPINRSNILGHYIPIVGSVTYAGLGVEAIQPNILSRIKTSDFPNFFLASSITGTFLYLYNRKHMRVINVGERWKYSLLGSSMFNLGSLLIWAIFRNVTADVDAPQFKFFIAVSTAYSLVRLGVNYVESIDRQIK